MYRLYVCRHITPRTSISILKSQANVDSTFATMFRITSFANQYILLFNLSIS